MCNGTLLTVKKISLEPGNARSVGQRLTHKATGAPRTFERSLFAHVLNYIEIGWMLGVDSISAYIGPSPRERQKEKKNQG